MICPNNYLQYPFFLCRISWSPAITTTGTTPSLNSVNRDNSISLDWVRGCRNSVCLSRQLIGTVSELTSAVNLLLTGVTAPCPSSQRVKRSTQKKRHSWQTHKKEGEKFQCNLFENSFCKFVWLESKLYKMCDAADSHNLSPPFSLSSWKKTQLFSQAKSNLKFRS